MRPKTILSIVGAAAALGTGGIAATGAIADSSPVAAPASAHFVRNIEGPIVAIDRASRTFTVADREHRNALSTVKVTPRTRFDNLAGFGGLHKGQRVEVKAVRANGALTATKVERGGRASGGSHDVNDDRRSSRAAEVGDDRGDRAVEVGDDRGGDRAFEAGDDRGGDRGHERGDDRGHGGHRGHDG